MNYAFATVKKYARKCEKEDSGKTSLGPSDEECPTDV